MAQIKGHNSGTNVRKMRCNNPKLDLAKMNAYIKFGEILSIGSQDIERKNTINFLLLFSNKMLARIANREDLDQTASSVV